MFEPFIPIKAFNEEDAIRVAKINIRGILDSYHGDWDFLIELMQNAVDALDLKFSESDGKSGEKPKIEVIINEKSGTVRVSDNGVGMPFNEAMLSLCPNYTNKTSIKLQGGKRSLRGHKGVGLTFLAFGYNLLRYCTRVNSEWFSGEIAGGRVWVESEDDLNVPKVIPSEYCSELLEECTSGTSVELLVGTNTLQHFNLSWLAWHYIIRCLTAGGYYDVNELLPWNKNVTVTLKVIDTNGKKADPPEGYTDSLPLEYFYPHKILKSCNLDAYFSQYPETTEPKKSEKGKYEALHVIWDTDKVEEVLFDKGKVEPSSSKYAHYLLAKKQLVSVYAMFTHSQRVWAERLDQGYSTDKRRHFWKPGIQVVTQQMPTGQSQEVSLPYRALNRDRFFMLVEIPDARPDYGRKGFKDEVNEFVQYLAQRLILGYFLRNKILLKPTAIAHGPTAVDAEAAVDERIQEVSTLPDLGVSTLNFKKEPKYENDVIALFSELLAREHIKGFELLSVSSGAQYDGIVNYRFTKEPKGLIYDPKYNLLGIPEDSLPEKDLLLKNLEFKIHLVDLINDFDMGVKNPQQVKFAVTWDEGDIQGSGYEITNLLEDDNYEHRTYHGQTHELISEPITIPVIMLKYIIKCLFGK